MKTQERHRVGLFSIGLETYWPQFPGLLDRLIAHNKQVSSQLESFGVEVVNLGMIDSTEKSFQAAHTFRQSDVALIFLHVATYALSSTVLPVVRRAKVPVIVLNLSPVAQIDYSAFNALGGRTLMTGEWLTYCQSCSIPEIANVFNRSHIKFQQVTGLLSQDDSAWLEIREWSAASRRRLSWSTTD